MRKDKTVKQHNTLRYSQNIADVVQDQYTVQAVRPTCHWWLCPRVLAWFRVLMILSLVKLPASAGPLSRIGDYLCAARGPGLCLWIRERTTCPHNSTATRGPPSPLFHRRPVPERRARHRYAHSAWYTWNTTTRIASSVNASKAASRKASVYLDRLAKFSAKAKGVSV